MISIDTPNDLDHRESMAKIYLDLAETIKKKDPVAAKLLEECAKACLANDAVARLDVDSVVLLGFFLQLVGHRPGRATAGDSTTGPNYG